MSLFQINQFLKIFSKLFFKIIFLLLGYFKDIRRLMKSDVIRINILEVIAFLLLKPLIPSNPLNNVCDPNYFLRVTITHRPLYAYEISS